MTRPATVLAVLLAAGPASAADPAALAAAVDRHIERPLTSASIPAAPPADDAAYFRRLHLALVGRVPAPGDARAFVADPDPDKRAKAIDRLLASAASANYLAAVWRGYLLPEALTTPEVAAQVPGFQAWLRERFASNAPYDKTVRDLLAAPLAGQRALSRRNEPEDPATSPMAFYVAKDGKPENLAAATSRLFLGVQLECAQCHDHPFARWTRDQFWGLAAFYGGVERPTPGGAVREVADRRELAVPNTERIARPAFLDDKEPAIRYRTSPRATLADWVTAPDNPFFARAAVNRVWAHLFGVGLVDPVDDLHEQNPPSHPELLDELAASFRAGGYDLRFLLAGLCRSAAFGRSSGLTDPRQQDARLYARFPVQGLPAEVLFDSFAAVIGEPADASGGGFLADGSAKRQFLETFNRVGRPTEVTTTIVQALALMNGPLVGGAAAPGRGRTLDAILGLPGLSAGERVDAIYYLVLSRPPSPEEAARAGRHVAPGSPDRYGDLLWALLNSAEFRTTH
ncbi:MAG: DUF1549 and DUF1553 domain-containing protein [Gemmataceae bacterium]|nr:DUF1549 and DUF1553 domain-containing protein [Gemmataceae bacterium]